MKYPTISVVATLALCHSAPAQTTLYDYVGVVDNGELGRGLAFVGDLNGDGLDDFAIGGPSLLGYEPSIGQIEVYSGRDGSSILTIASPVGGNETYLGERICSLGDVTGDGIPDLVTTVTVVNPGVFDIVAQIRSGADGSVVASDLVKTSSRQSSWFKQNPRPVGDINGDSVVDFIIGLPEAYDGTFSGRHEIRSGLDATLIRGVDADSSTQGAGIAVAGVGDLTGDGVNDYAVGASGPRVFNAEAGWIRLYSGADGSTIFTKVGPTDTYGLGYSIAAIKDINSDGVDDLIVGSEPGFHSDRAGAVQAISGVDGSTILEVLGSPGDRLGAAVCAAGDYDDDGTPDFAASATGANMSQGRVTIYSGVDASVLATMEGSAFMGTAFGQVLEGGGDINGDGFSDLLVMDLNMERRGRALAFGRSPNNGGTLCKGQPNSTGQRAKLITQSPSGFDALANDLTLTVTQLPMNSMGYFVVSSNFYVIPNAGGSSGRLCVASQQIGRYSGNVLNSGASGSVSFMVDTTMIPLATPNGTVIQSALPGSIFNFQFWYRHSDGMGGVTSNFSDAVTILFN